MMTADDERYLRTLGYGEICDRVRKYEQEIRRIDDEKISVLREQIKGFQRDMEKQRAMGDVLRCLINSPRFQNMTVREAIGELIANGMLREPAKGGQP